MKTVAVNERCKSATPSVTVIAPSPVISLNNHTICHSNTWMSGSISSKAVDHCTVTLTLPGSQTNVSRAYEMTYNITTTVAAAVHGGVELTYTEGGSNTPRHHHNHTDSPPLNDGVPFTEPGTAEYYAELIIGNHLLTHPISIPFPPTFFCRTLIEERKIIVTLDIMISVRSKFSCTFPVKIYSATKPRNDELVNNAWAESKRVGQFWTKWT